MASRALFYSRVFFNFRIGYLLAPVLVAVQQAFLDFQKTDPLLSYYILIVAHTERNTGKIYGETLRGLIFLLGSS